MFAWRIKIHVVTSYLSRTFCQSTVPYSSGTLHWLIDRATQCSILYLNMHCFPPTTVMATQQTIP